MRGRFSDYGELGITQVTEAVELAKVLRQKAKKLCLDVEFMYERDFNQQSEDGYVAAHDKCIEFYEVLRSIGDLGEEKEEGNPNNGSQDGDA